MVRHLGYDIVPYLSTSQEYPSDFTEDHASVIRAVRPYTMTSPERLYALIEAVRYTVQQNIPGSIVECGVWRGGSIMAAALTLMRLKRTDRQFYLFDTFDGMPMPLRIDQTHDGIDGGSIFEVLKTGEDSSDYCRATLQEVREALATTDYPAKNFQLIKGKVEDTLPQQAPASIAILRLDTDWYESTKHELEHLFPRLSRGGILIIDDYGHWNGCREAVDEYFDQIDRGMFLARIDYTGRIGLKTA
jgi:hypothetical protein